MTKLLLVLEHHFIVDSNNIIWSDRVIDDKFLERYTKVFNEVHILARAKQDTPKENFKKISSSKIKLIKLNDFRGTIGLVKNFFSIVTTFRKSMEKCDVVLFRAPSPLSILLYRFVPVNYPSACEFVMGAEKFFSSKSNLGRLLNSIVINQSKKLALNMNGVSYVTEYKLQENYPNKAVLNGESENYFTENYSSIDLEKDFFFKKDFSVLDKQREYVLIEVGFMDSYRKGQDILIRASKILIDRGYSIKVYLVGDGKKRKEFEDLAIKLDIRDHIRFIGAVSDKKKLQKILLQSDIFVLPSQSEGLPRVLIEAMAVGLPAIASNVDGIPELIAKDFLVSDFSIENYANKIELLINDYSLIVKTSEQNYKKSQEFEKSLLIERRLRFYTKLNNLALRRDSIE